MSKQIQNSYDARELNRQYAYYNRLWKTNPVFAGHITHELAWNFSPDDAKAERQVKGLQSLAARERTKELALLKEKFGIDISKYIDGKSYEDIIEVINIILSTQKVYERLLKKINSKDNRDKVKPTISSLLGSYIWSAFQDVDSKILTLMEQATKEMKNSPRKDLMDILDEEIEKLLIEATTKGLKKALYSKDLRAEAKDKEADASLKDFWLSMTRATKNNLIREIFDIWGLKDVKEILLERVKGQIEGANIEPLLVDDEKIKSLINSDSRISGQRGGITMELISKALVSTFGNKLDGKKAGDFTIQQDKHTSSVYGYHTGGTKMAADNIFTVGIKKGALNNFLEDNSFNSREKKKKSFDGFKNFTENLQSFEGGFIIMANAKNYSLKQGSFKGFSGGEPWSMSDLEAMLTQVMGGAKKLIGAVMNVRTGLIGYAYKESISQDLAQAAAYFLFDDFETLGENVVAKEGTNRVIHLLYLDGFYIPVSFFLDLLAKSWYEISDSRKVFSVTIHPFTSALYPPGADTGHERWVAQRQRAYNEQKVSVKFLKNLTSVLSSLKI